MATGNLKNYNKIKIALIALVILNIAFISGFVVKKISASNAPDTSTVPDTVYSSNLETNCEIRNCNEPCILNDKKVGYQHLCKKPGFKETFEEYRELHRNASQKLAQIKIAYLSELKKDHSDPVVIDRLIKEMNRTSNDLNEKNYSHLQALKRLLPLQEFNALIDCMNHTLNAHNNLSFSRKNVACEENHSH